MTFNFESYKEEIALTGDDFDAYPQIGVIERSRWIPYETYPFKLGHSNIWDTSTGHSGQPLTVDDLQQFAGALEAREGRWYIRWYEDERGSQDVDLDYDFRGVVAFGTLDFTIRPIQNDAEIRRLR